MNNESSEIIRIFNTAFNDHIPDEKAKLDLYPENLRGEIDGLNEWIYPSINSGSFFVSLRESTIDACRYQMGCIDRASRLLRKPTKRQF